MRGRQSDDRTKRRGKQAAGGGRGGMMYLSVCVGFLLNTLILGACSDKFGLIKVSEMPTCLRTSIRRWDICHSQWKSSGGF